MTANTLNSYYIVAGVVENERHTDNAESLFSAFRTFLIMFRKTTYMTGIFANIK